MSDQTFTLPDGRKLGYAVEGDGEPVIYFHGTASSRLEIFLLKQFANNHKFRLIGIDRPGYGLSTFADRTALGNSAADVNALADHLNLDAFSVLAWSGGGPFALAYTAQNPDRVAHAIVVGSPSLPFDPATAHNNNPFAKLAMKTPVLAKLALRVFRRSVLKANRNIDRYLGSSSGKNMIASWPESDARFFANPQWLRVMYGAMAEGFRQNEKSLETIYQEHRLFMKSWNEHIEQIPAGKLTVWQGEQDKTCPTSNAMEIVQIVKGARMELFPDEGHCVMFSKVENLAKDLRT